MAEPNVAIVEGIEPQYVEDALRILHEAFARKLRHGFRDADDMVRLFHDSVDRASCYSAIVDGRCLGALTWSTRGREFYQFSARALLTRFSPWRALRILFNCLLLLDTPAANELIVESVAVSPSARGLGLGTLLMERAHDRQAAVVAGRNRRKRGRNSALRAPRLPHHPHAARLPGAPRHRLRNRPPHGKAAPLWRLEPAYTLRAPSYPRKSTPSPPRKSNPSYPRLPRVSRRVLHPSPAPLSVTPAQINSVTPARSKPVIPALAAGISPSSAPKPRSRLPNSARPTSVIPAPFPSFLRRQEPTRPPPPLRAAMLRRPTQAAPIAGVPTCARTPEARTPPKARANRQSPPQAATQ